jgi:DNA-binding MarR family transcriptional regulator
MHPSTLTGILARLEKQGLIRREIDESDRRKSQFQLTQAGKRVDREKKGTVEAAVRRAIGRASTSVIAGTTEMLQLLVAELDRAD